MHTEEDFCVSSYSEGFPVKLKNIRRVPEKLHIRGALPDPGLPAVAIVGARMCTPYGKNQAYRFAAELARQGVQIISGLAQGIDSMAHEGALSVVGGKTFGVLGCGLDVVYPRQNAGLYKRVAQNGGLISESSDQRSGGYCTGDRGQRKERIADHRGFCPGAGTKRICFAGPGRRCAFPGL